MIQAFSSAQTVKTGKRPKRGKVRDRREFTQAWAGWATPCLLQIGKVQAKRSRSGGAASTRKERGTADPT